MSIKLSVKICRFFATQEQPRCQDDTHCCLPALCTSLKTPDITPFSRLFVQYKLLTFLVYLYNALFSCILKHAACIHVSSLFKSVQTTVCHVLNHMDDDIMTHSLYQALLSAREEPWYNFVDIRNHWRLLEITRDYWRLVEITEDYWRLLEITGDYWRPLNTISIRDNG